jgi:hypothetical protein
LTKFNKNDIIINSVSGSSPKGGNMLLTLKFIKISEEEYLDLLRDLNSPYIIVRLQINPPLDESLIHKLQKIKGVGWLEEQSDFANIVMVSPTEIIIEGCHPWCLHTQFLVNKIIEVLKQKSLLDFKDPNL